MRLLAAAALAASLFGLAETAYVTAARADGFRAAAAEPDGRSVIGGRAEGADLGAARLVRRRRLRSAAGVGLASCLAWATFGGRRAAPATPRKTSDNQGVKP